MSGELKGGNDPGQQQGASHGQLQEFFEGDAFAAKCGIELLEFSPGKARCKMTVGPEHLNGFGVCHGGAVFTLADFAFAAASNSHGNLAMAINANISFVKAVNAGVLYAEAWEETRNPRLGTYAIRVTDEAGDTAAVFQGLVYRKNTPVTEFLGR